MENKLLYTVFFSLIVLSISCKNVEENNSELSISKNITSLYYEDSVEVFLSEITSIKKYDGKVYLLDGVEKVVYILDDKWNISSRLEMFDYAYLFKGPIVDFVVINKNIYFADHTFNIKVFNTNTRILTYFEYGKLQNGIPLISTMSVLDDSTIVASVTGVRKDFTNDLNEYIFGIKFTIEGELLNLYKFRLNDDDILPIPLHDKSFVSANNDMVCFNFGYHKYVYIFDKNNSLVFQTELDIDESYASREVKFEIGQYHYRPISYGALPFYEKHYFYYKCRGPGKISEIVQYSSNMKKKAVFKIIGLDKKATYKLFFIDNKLLLIDKLSPTIFLTKVMD